MRFVPALLLTVANVLIAADTGHQRLTPPAPVVGQAGESPDAFALRHVRETARSLGIAEAGVEGTYLYKSYRTEHNGVTHLIYRQRFQGVDVWEKEWVVNLDAEGRILNSGGILSDGPAQGVAPPDASSAHQAARRAVESAYPNLRGRFAPFATRRLEARPGAVVFSAGPLGAEVIGEPAWYSFRGSLIPAWSLMVTGEDGMTSYEVVVEAESGKVFERRSNTFYQQAAAPKGLVFDKESPQPNPTPGVRLNAAPPFVERTLVTLSGDPKGSPLGWVNGNTTSGNNVVAGQNRQGVRFNTEPKLAVAGADGNFTFPYDGRLGSNPLDYSDASTTNMFYWINRAHDYFYALGFDEQAGNFQVDNLGRGGSGGDPVYAYTHFSAAGPGGASTNNAFFSWRNTDDGSQVMLAMFLTSGGTVRLPGDTALEADVVVHEYTHGVSGRLVRNGYTTFQGASMGEAWSDYFGLELATPEGAPPDGVYPVGEYFLQSWGLGIRTRPYSTNMEVNSLTYAKLGNVVAVPEVHADGEIWFEALWETRAELIAQFGEREGRRRAAQIIIDSMKLSPPAPSMVDMRDAILLADRTDFKGASQAQIWRAFAKRGLGVLAYSPDGESTAILASNEAPGAPRLAVYRDSQIVGESTLILLSDPANTTNSAEVAVTSNYGDREISTLTRRGSTFIGTVRTSASSTAGAGVLVGDNILQIISGDRIQAAYPASSPQTSASVTVFVPYSQAQAPAPADFKFANEQRISNGDTTVTVPLPFAFPFYGQPRRSIDVSANGRLGFGLPIFDDCEDPTAFVTYPSIAPLFVQFYSPAPDPSWGVFMSQTSDSVTFRWEGGVWGNGVFPPPPLRFAATLFRDGRIQFDYGPGNQNLHVALAGSPICGSGPVFGLSPGRSNLGQPALVTGSLDRGPSIVFTGANPAAAPPEGFVETPAAGTKTGVALRISGAALNRNGGAVSLAWVLVDGVYAGQVPANRPRPDACARFGFTSTTCGAVGFDASVSLAARRLAPGEHKLRVLAMNTAGVTTDLVPEGIPFNYDVQSVPPEGKIEAPADGSTVSGTITLRGYVYSAATRIQGVDIVLDGATIGGIIYGVPRADICNALPVENRPVNCPGVGFQVNLSTVTAPLTIPDGPHKFRLRARDVNGLLIDMPETEITLNVVNGGAAPSTGVLSTPENNQTISGDSVLIWGYAWSPFPGRRVTQVRLTIDGSTVQVLNYGEERGNECKDISNPPAACPNIGFSGRLDTTRLSNGPHGLGITVVNDRGEAVTIPSAIRQGINVFVKN